MDNTEMPTASLNKELQGVENPFSFSGEISFSVHYPDPSLGKPFSIHISYTKRCLLGAGFRNAIQSRNAVTGSSEKISRNSHIFFAPWMGAVVYNWKWHDSRFKAGALSRKMANLSQNVSAAMIGGSLEKRTARCQIISGRSTESVSAPLLNFYDGQLIHDRVIVIRVVWHQQTAFNHRIDFTLKGNWQPFRGLLRCLRFPRV